MIYTDTIQYLDRDIQVTIRREFCPGDRHTPPSDDREVLSVEYEGRDVTRLVDLDKVQQVVDDLKNDLF
jgi:hypothetical protein